jgi:hypothetical protein
VIRIILVTFLFLSGCATQDPAPVAISVATSEPPCDSGKMPQKPVVFPADALKGDEDIWVMGTTLWADRKARLAYEALLSAFAEECARR